MLSHSTIWDAIDTLASRHGLSPSGLARLAGLDSTAFNKSKRISKDGRERWPSTESISKILEATDESFTDFARDSGYQQSAEGISNPSVPIIGFAQAEVDGFFDPGGNPTGDGWDEVSLPSGNEDGTYALEVTGDAMLPLYRDGDVIVVSAIAQLRRGDRVIAKLHNGPLVARVLHRQTTKNIQLALLADQEKPETIELKDIDWVARILWASQ